MVINKQDTNGTKALLQVGELGYDNYPGGGDKGRVYVGEGTSNIALAKKSEVAAKVAANADIVAGTAAKITYDVKGLVVSGTALSATDIPALDAGKITTGTLPVARGGTGATTSTGTGALVFSNSPVLVAPTLGVATGTSFNSITGLSSAYPSPAGVSEIGTSTLAARQDHVHPAQTTVSGNAGTATILATGRTIGMTGDVTWTSESFNGGGNVTGTATLATIADSGTGTFKKISTNSKGLVTGTVNVTQTDITGLLGTGSISNTMLANGAVANLSGTNTGDETLATIKTKLGITTLSGSNTGDQTISLTGDVVGNGTGSFVTALKNTGTAGTYRSVTTDAQGRVISGTNPTTISGYGITDAVTKVTSTGNAIPKFNGTTGDIQDSNILIDSSGNLNITGTGKRITGDFSNATEANKVAFQTSTVNSATVLCIVPNGTSTTAVSRNFNSSDVNNSSNGNFRISSVDVGILSAKSGTGSYLPIAFYTSDVERMRIDTAGNVLVTGTGGLGYGAGSGGTVTQLTSKSTTVTLNKPTGQIIMNNAALAAGTLVQFNLLNSLVSSTDTVELTLKQPSSAVPMLIELTWAVDNGLVQIGVRNNHTSSLSEAIGLNFTINKGANS